MFSSHLLHLRLLYVFIISFLGLTGCSSFPSSNRLDGISTFYNFGNGGMIKDRQYVFSNYDSTLNVSSGKFSMLLTVRYNDRCKISELPLEVEYPDDNTDTIVKREILVSLFNENDNYEGTGNFGIYEKTIPFQDDYTVGDGFFVSVATSASSTKGIISIGLNLKEDVTIPR